MYNAQIIKERLKEQQKIKGVKNIDNMMEELDLGVNIVRQMSDKKGIGCFALAKIADYLGCSVDYLLGRVDTPNGTYSIKGDNNVQINGNSGNHSTFTINNSEQPNRDKLKEDFMKVFDTLDFNDKIEVMQFAVNKTKK